MTSCAFSKRFRYRSSLARRRSATAFCSAFSDSSAWMRASPARRMRELRAAKKAPGQERIYTAGEKEYYNTQRLRAEGIPVNANLQRDLKVMQQECGLSQHSLGF